MLACYTDSGILLLLSYYEVRYGQKQKTILLCHS